MHYRTNKHGVIHPVVDRLVSRHVRHKVAVRTARRRSNQAGMPMAIVTWHDASYVVMPAWRAAWFDEQELLVEYILH
jgi:hypothetical protein